MVIMLLIILPIIFIPLFGIYKPIRVKCMGDEEPKGVLVDKDWGEFFRDLCFWRNKYH